MTDNQWHPSQFQQITNAYYSSAIGSWACVAAMLLSLSFGAIATNPRNKAIFAGCALAATAVGSTQRRSFHRSKAYIGISENAQLQGFAEFCVSIFAPVSQFINSVDSGTALPEPPEMFSVGTITDPDGCTCVAIVGASGSGKTMLTQHLIGVYFPGAGVKVYDTDAKPDDWKGLEVIGRKGATQAIADEMESDLQTLATRTELRGDGKPVGDELVRVVEEFPTLASDLEEPQSGRQKNQNKATNWLKRLVRRGRKYRMKVFLVSQEFQVESLKIGGEGELRKAFTVFYLGSAAFEAVKKEPDRNRKDSLREWLKMQTRPCLVYHQGQFYPCSIPDLSVAYLPPSVSPAIVVDSSPKIPSSNSAEVSIRECLEGIYNASPSYQKEQSTNQNELINKLPVHLQSIVQFARKNGRVKAREIKQNVRACNSYSTEQIREFFKVLESIGVGRCLGDGDRLEFGDIQDL